MRLLKLWKKLSLVVHLVATLARCTFVKLIIKRVGAGSLCVALNLATACPCGIAQTTSGQASSPRHNQTSGAAAPVIEDYVLYRAFFGNIGSVEKVATEREAAGKDGSKWRTHFQRGAGLSNDEGKILTQVADDCNQALQSVDQNLQAAIATFHVQNPNAKMLQVPPEITQLFALRKQIIQAHIDQLQSQLGTDSFQKLAKYVRANITVKVVPVTRGTTPAVSTTQGGPGETQ